MIEKETLIVILLIQSGELAVAMYSTQWYTMLNKSDRKLFQILLAMSQQNISFKALGIVPVNYNLFLQVLCYLQNFLSS